MDRSYRDGQRRVTLLERCRDMRQGYTDAELLLWRRLRSRQIAGAKFRRQHQFGPYILDFFCPERNLAIEADGGQHLSPNEAAADAVRTRYLESRGIRVMRFTNVEILQETEAVLQVIEQALVSPSP